MNATEDVNWLDMPSVLDSTVERLKAVKALGLNVGLDFHGRLHKRTPSLMSTPTFLTTN
jgi:galactonate dehydratase